jgi:hypothetical protein
MKSLGHEEYVTFVGIRADEQRRVAKMKNNKDIKETPLATAGIGVGDVLDFWSKQPFDLETITVNGQVEGEHFIRGVVNEQVNTAASQAGVARFLININERVNLSENSVLTYLWNPIPDTAVGNFSTINTSSVPNWGPADTATEPNFEVIDTV